MHLEKDEFRGNENFLFYEFYSKGPDGIVKKVVEFVPDSANGKIYVHLTFGDWDEKLKTIDDRIVTNNTDTKKILATVAEIVLRFTEHYSNLAVYAKGSTAARTRLYQMGLMENIYVNNTCKIIEKEKKESR